MISGSVTRECAWRQPGQHIIPTILLALTAVMTPGAWGHFVASERETFDGTEKDTATWQEYAPYGGQIYQNDMLVLDAAPANVIDYTTTEVAIGVGDTVRVELIEHPLGRAESVLYLTTNTQDFLGWTTRDSDFFFVRYSYIASHQDYGFTAGSGGDGHYGGHIFGLPTPPPAPGHPLTLEIHRDAMAHAVCTAYDSNMVPIECPTTSFLPNTGVTGKLYISLWAWAEQGGRTIFDNVTITRHSPVDANGMDTLASWGGATLDDFGETPTEPPDERLIGSTLGQTFRIDREGWFSLDRISFILDDHHPSHLTPEVCTFEVYVTPWSGTRPIREILYQSEPLVTAGSWKAETFTLETGPILLAGRTRYLVFLTANNFLNGTRSDAATGYVHDMYPNGAFYSIRGLSFEELFSTDWSSTSAGRRDLAIKLEWSSWDERMQDLAADPQEARADDAPDGPVQHGK